MATVGEAVAGAAQDLGSEGTAVGAGDPSRFALFHAPNSICSQKVRVVLAHHGIAYVSQSMSLFTGDSYRPGYVRLRMLGCAALGDRLADVHDGNTATDASGCDGVVVPTLVDAQAGEVLVDSKRICLRLDDLAPEDARLRPAALAAAVDAELAVVDGLPNYQMLMGRAREEGEATVETMAAFSRRKVEWCDAYLAEHSDEPPLVAAYTAKRAKEQSTADAAVARLDNALAAEEGPWLVGPAPTMADLFWGLELMRMRNVGAARFWDDRPRVAQLLAAAEALPAIRSAVIDWPGALY